MSDSVVRRITWRNADIANVFLMGMIFLFVWKFFWMVYSALFLGLLSVLIAILLNVPARFFSKYVPFRVAFALTVVLFLGALGTLFVVLIPQLLHQLPLLARQVPAAIALLTSWIEQQTGAAGGGRVVEQINQQLAEFVGRFVPLAFNLIGVIAGSIAIFTLAIFFGTQPGLYRDLLLRLVPPGGRERASEIYDESGRTLRSWVLGKTLQMAIVGVLVTVGLTLFGVPGAMALGAVSAVFEFIPTFGPTIGAVPGIVSAFLISPRTALYVAIYYFVIQHLQNAFTVPLVERKAVNIPPAALLMWQLMLAVGFGLLGLFVATPLLAVLTVAVRVLYVEPGEARYAWDRRDAAGLAMDDPATLPPGR
jgi:predicted PurR-regulated permease PerM